MKATIQVETIDDFKWLNSSYCSVLRQLESARTKEYYFEVNHPTMVVKIVIWIIRSHNFTISPHQNFWNRTRIVKMVGSYRIVESYGILPILPILPKHQFLVFFFFRINFWFWQSFKGCYFSMLWWYGFFFFYIKLC